MARRLDEPELAARLRAQEPGDEIGNGGAAFRAVRRGGESALACRPALRTTDHEEAGAGIEGAVQQGHPGIGHQAGEVLLGQEARRRFVEGRVPLRQGEAAIMRDDLALREHDLLQALGAQPFDRVAIEMFDAHDG